MHEKMRSRRKIARYRCCIAACYKGGIGRFSVSAHFCLHAGYVQPAERLQISPKCGIMAQHAMSAKPVAFRMSGG